MRRNRCVTFSLCAILGVSALACGGDSAGPTTPPPPPPAVPTTVQISPATLNLEIGQSLQLSATVLDDRGQAMTGQSISWSSSDTTKIVVEQSGMARGVREGGATITARTGSIQATRNGAVVRPEIRFEETASVTARIGPAGGSIEARGANGTTFRLTIPPSALGDSTNITLTPVASLGATTLHGAVKMGPSGLKFTVPAQMVVTLPTAPTNTADILGFQFTDDGKSVGRYPVSVSGRELAFVIGHFSGVGGAGQGVTNLLTVPSGSSPSAVATAAIDAAIIAGDLPGITGAFRVWYNAAVKPRLSVANTDSAATEAIAEWSYWQAMMTVPSMVPFAGQVIAALAAEMTEARSLAATAIQLAIIRENAICVAQRDFLAVARVLTWQQRAEANNIATVQFALDRQSVLEALCMKLRHVTVSMPDTLRPGREATLRVQVGMSVGGGPLEFTVGFLKLADVATTPAGSTSDSTRSQRTDDIGVITRQIAPADTLEMSVRVRSCMNSDVGLALGLPAFNDICADTTITRTATNALYLNTFSNGPPGSEWSTQQTTTSPSGQRFLGELGNASTTLSLNSLPAHTSLTLEFDIYIIDSWNGNGGVGSASAADIVEISVVGGATLKRTNFSNKPSDPQAYPGDHPGSVQAAGTGALSKGALGYPPDNDHFGDSVYRIKLTFVHTNGIIAIRFASQQTSGQNERWGLDNVRLSLTP